MKTRTRILVRLALCSVLGLGAAPTLVAAQNALSRSGPVGEPEGITVVADQAQWPKSFNEAPALAAPVKEVGKYGGTWRRGFTGPGDNENGNRINASDRPLLVDHTGAKPMPALARAWRSDDGKTFTLFLRRGLRWSDGAPMTANDFGFWFEDIGVRLVSDRLGYVPARNCIAQPCRAPGGAHPETWFYRD